MSAAPEQDLFGDDPFAMDALPSGDTAGAAPDGSGFPAMAGVGAFDAPLAGTGLTVVAAEEDVEEEETDKKTVKAKKGKATKEKSPKQTKVKTPKPVRPKGPRYPATTYSWLLRTVMFCMVVAVAFALLILGLQYGFAMKP